MIKKEDDHSISMLTSEIIKINLQKSFGYELLTKSYLMPDLASAPEPYPGSAAVIIFRLTASAELVLDESRTKAAITYIMEHYERTDYLAGYCRQYPYQ